jgi:hypothetical protein
MAVLLGTQGSLDGTGAERGGQRGGPRRRGEAAGWKRTAGPGRGSPRGLVARTVEKTKKLRRNGSGRKRTTRIANGTAYRSLIVSYLRSLF